MTDPTVADLASWAAALAGLDAPGEGMDSSQDAVRVDLLRGLEQLKGAVDAAQHRVAHAFEESQREEQRRAGVPAQKVGEGIALQVALALRESHQRAARLLGTARMLCTEMPQTLAALSEGRIDEWRAMLLVRETACLSEEHRRTIDEKVAGGDDVERLGTKHLISAAHHLAARLDSAGVAERQRLAERDRRVTIRPAPDTMSYVTALVPVADGVAMYAALKRHADAAAAAGDERGRGQVMADTAVELVTGRSTDVPPPVDLHLIMTDRALLAGDDEPAHLPGYGVVPAEWARDLVGRAASAATAWVRRLYVMPGGRSLMAMDSRRRTVPAGLAEFIAARDLLCRTPWCGAPVRHVDHIRPHRDTGTTQAYDLQALCERCNHAKEALGWSSRPRPGPVHATEITTPTGHTYLSFAPLLPGDDEAA
ncbi:HNH endonuclease signature motif containing protein [Nocardioides sp. 1609]|uniref:HNH endonuclease n=1 Tax=Nocardioides sp. 1609 TaxID=2508327 RepID=UPI00107027A9|nr:HNH endonuclease signature motif containing protein [Nocardioides sp. 1609]